MRLFTVEQCAELVGCARSTIYPFVLSGELESIKIGSLRRIPEDAFSDWVARLRASQDSPAAVSDAA